MVMLWAVVLTWASGCVTVYTPASVQARQLTSQERQEVRPRWEDWPGRTRVWSGVWRTTWRAMPPAPAGIIEPVEWPLVALRRTAQDQERFEASLRRDSGLLASRRMGGGVAPLVSVTSEGPGSYVFVRGQEEDARAAAQSPAGAPVLALQFTSGREGAGGDVRMERTWFAVYAPRTPGAARGLVVLVPGLFGTPRSVTDSLVGVLTRRGWSVLRMMAHPSRFTERRQFELTSDDPGQVERAGRDLAAELTDRAAECAYAVHAAVLYLRQQAPDLVRGPRVYVGLSAGAMVAPTVIALRPEDWSAAVLVGGGVDYLRTALESSYAGWVRAVSVRFTGSAATPAVRRALEEAYARHARLDSARLAPLLRSMPVLLIDAAGDTAVPAALATRLWELAGRPERWTSAGGHEWLFMVLPGRFERLLEWLDASVPARGDAGAAAPSAPEAPRAGAGAVGRAVAC
jgi:dienelactone hydrolase